MDHWIVLFQKSRLVHEFSHLSIAFKVLVVIGALIVLRLLFAILGFLRRNFLASGKSLRSFGAGTGAFAVITGATDGIGKEYAKLLAKRGFNILIISRSEDRLKETVHEIKSATPDREVKYLAVDLSKLDDTFPDKLRGTGVKDIGVLVNNVGMSYEVPAPFHELSLSFLRSIVDLNVKAAVEVTHAVLPHMRTKRRGLILNISSAASTFPAPLLSVYSGTKAFINMWTEGLAAELAHDGIHVEAQTPGYVVSKLSRIRRASLAVPTPAAFVRSSLAALGTTRRPISSPWLFHQLESIAVCLIPYPLKVWLVHRNLRDVRRRALKRAAEQQQQHGADAKKGQ